MTAAEFAGKVIGVPWVRWAAGWDGMDCWGLVVLYHRHVLHVELGPVPQTDIEAGYWAAREDWPECPPEPGSAVFMAWRGGHPMHCGVLMPGGMLLHSQGDSDRGGSVQMTRLPVMQRAYGDLRFHRYAGSAAPC